MRGAEFPLGFLSGNTMGLCSGAAQGGTVAEPWARRFFRSRKTMERSTRAQASFALCRLPRISLSFPPRKRGPRNRGGPAATERTSAQWAFRRHGACALLKNSTPCASEAVVVQCPFGCRPELGGLGVPAFARITRDRKARGPAAAVVPLSQYGPQRSGLSAGTMPGFPPRSFPPRKRGPRTRGGAAATVRTSAQRIFRRHGA